MSIRVSTSSGMRHWIWFSVAHRFRHNLCSSRTIFNKRKVRGSKMPQFLNWYFLIVLTSHRPTQSVKYVPLQVNTFAESILLIVQYSLRYLKSCSRDFYSPESDPPHKIMRYWFYYSIWLGFSFPPDRICQVEMFVLAVYQFRKGISAGPALKYFTIHMGARCAFASQIRIHLNKQLL